MSKRELLKRFLTFFYYYSLLNWWPNIYRTLHHSFRPLSQKRTILYRIILFGDNDHTTITDLKKRLRFVRVPHCYFQIMQFRLGFSNTTTKCNFIFNMAFAPLCTGHHYSTMHKILQVTRKNMSNKESGPLILQSHIVTYDIKKNHFVLTFDRSNTLKRTCIVPSYMVEVKMIFFLFFVFCFVCFCLFLGMPF